MKNIQISLTIHEGKYLIAEGLSRLPQIKKVVESRKLLLKGGTTVSAFSEHMFKLPLRISGRITPRGCKGTQSQEGTHTLIIDKSKILNPYTDFTTEKLEEIISSMTSDDVAVISPNIIDNYGNAAMMAGAPLGGPPGRVISGLMAEGVTILLPAGLEKLSPGNVIESIRAAGRKRPNKALGMGVGLIPLTGKIFTELDAIKAMGDFEVTVIGKGGMDGQEGGVTLSITGTAEDIDWIFKILTSIKGKKTSGVTDTLIECTPNTEQCHNHIACIYSLH